MKLIGVILILILMSALQFSCQSDTEYWFETGYEDGYSNGKSDVIGNNGYNKEEIVNSSGIYPPSDEKDLVESYVRGYYAGYAAGYAYMEELENFPANK